MIDELPVDRFEEGGVPQVSGEGGGNRPADSSAGGPVRVALKAQQRHRLRQKVSGQPHRHRRRKAQAGVRKGQGRKHQAQEAGRGSQAGGGSYQKRELLIIMHDVSHYIKIDNLNFGMNEGDIAVVFSEFGEIIDLRLMRNPKTGRSLGTAYICFEDPRSITLTTENFDRAEICGRTVRVSLDKKFRPEPEDHTELRPTGPDGKGWGQWRKDDS